jgi:hypothetical protein
MIKPTKVYYYYAYQSDDGMVLSLPSIPTSQDINQLKRLYEMYKEQIKGNLKSKKHIIIKVTTAYEEVE